MTQATRAGDDPCDADRYKALLQTPFAGMGDNEYTYFVALDKACRQYKRTHLGDAFDVCQHAPYADLVKAKAPAAMSKREYDYFVEVDRECAANQGVAQEAEPQKKSSIPARLLVGLAVLGATVANLVASIR